MYLYSIRYTLEYKIDSTRILPSLIFPFNPLHVAKLRINRIDASPSETKIFNGHHSPAECDDA